MPPAALTEGVFPLAGASAARIFPVAHSIAPVYGATGFAI